MSDGNVVPIGGVDCSGTVRLLSVEEADTEGKFYAVVKLADGDHRDEPTDAKRFMTDDEAITAVQNGDRAITECSLHSQIIEADCWPYHSWRTVACNDELDVIECRLCGRQQVAKCNFDEDFA